MVSTKDQDSDISISQQAYSKYSRENHERTAKEPEWGWWGGGEGREQQQTVRINKNLVSSEQLTSVESVVKILNLVEMSESK